MCTEEFSGSERYESFHLIGSFEGLNVDKRRQIQGPYLCSVSDVVVRMTNRFHHLQMKWCEHTLKCYWSSRVRTRTEFVDKWIPPKVYFALSWVLGRDCLTYSPCAICHLLHRAFLLDRLYKVYEMHESAPFCISDYLRVTHFVDPMLSAKRQEENASKRPLSVRCEKDRHAFQEAYMNPPF